MTLSELLQLPDKFAEYILKKPEMLIKILGVRSSTQLIGTLRNVTDEKIKTMAIALIHKTLNEKMRTPEDWLKLVNEDMLVVFRMSITVIDLGIKLIMMKKLKQTGVGPEEYLKYAELVEKLVEIKIYQSKMSNIFGWQMIVADEDAKGMPEELLMDGIDFIDSEIKRLEERFKACRTEREKGEVIVKTQIAIETKNRILKIIESRHSLD